MKVLRLKLEDTFVGNVQLKNSYAVGYLYEISEDGILSPVSNIDGNKGVLGGISYTNGSLNSISNLKVFNDANVIVDNVYAVANNSLYYFGEKDKDTSEEKIIVIKTAESFKDSPRFFVVLYK